MLDATSHDAKLQDFLRLALKANQPPMTGIMSFRTRIDIPPGKGVVVERLQLDGNFVISSGLRDEYLQADMGVSGVNFAAADTGTIVLVENEGNAGLSTAAPPVHVALMGIEKMLPRLEHLPVFLNLLARSGTGQKLTSYTHLIHGPTEGQQLYIILLDNGRSGVLEDPAAWKAICVHPLRGVPERLPRLSPRRRLGLRLGLSRPDRLDPHAASGRPGQGRRVAFASSLCGACGEMCPVRITSPISWSTPAIARSTSLRRCVGTERLSGPGGRGRWAARCATS